MMTGVAARAETAEATNQVTYLGQSLEALARVGGPWVQQEAVPGLMWGQILLAAATLLAVAGLAHGLGYGLRRLARRTEEAGPDAAANAPVATDTPGETRPGKEHIQWIKLGLEALVPPLILFIWIWGGYAAVTLLLGRVEESRPASFLLDVAAWVKNAGEIAALFWFLFRMISVVETRLRRWTALTASKWDDVLVILVVRALRLIVPLIGVILVVPTLDLPASTNQLFKQGASLLLIGAIGFILYQLANAVEDAVLQQFRIDVKDNLEARKVYTQVKVLKKIAMVVIVLFTAASMLMVFDSVRQLGTSLLASAGVAGIIIGFAAQRSLATVLAGFQIALTQPIRIDDVVIVENEWGRIEEITLTYVVVVIWDQRRLVLPINYFIEQPFQNWTRVSAELLGTVFLYVDYTVPFKALRDELDRVLANSELWDRRVKVVQATDAKPNVLEVRVLVSAADAGKAFDLRCEVREQLIDFLQRNYPQCLPRTRAEIFGKPEPQIS